MTVKIKHEKGWGNLSLTRDAYTDHSYWLVLRNLAGLSCPPLHHPTPTVSRASRPEEGHSGLCAPQRDPGELHAEVYSSSPPSPLYPLRLLVPILSVLLRLFALFGKYLTFNLNNSSEQIWSHAPTCYFKSHRAITLWWNLVSGERETVGMVICSPRSGQKAWLESCPHYWLSL